MELAKTLDGSSSLETIFAGIHMFKFLTDEIISIQEAKQIKQLLSGNDPFTSNVVTHN